MIIPGLIGVVAANSVPPITVTHWTNGGADGLVTNPANFDNGLPSATKDVVFDDAYSVDNCTVPNISSYLFCKSFNSTNYTGQIITTSPSSIFRIFAYGDVTLGAGMANTNLIDTRFKANGTLVSAYSKVGIEMNSPTNLEVTIGSNIQANELDIQDDQLLILGNKVVDFSTAGGGLYGNTTVDVSFTAGGKFKFSDASMIDLEFDGGGTAPPIELAVGCGGVNMLGALVDSWAQAGGTLGAGGGALTVTNDFVGTGGAINGVTVNVGGAATASGMTITNANFGGGTTLLADNTCTDGGGNTNVTFAP